MKNIWTLFATVAAMVCLPFATAALGADLTPAIVTLGRAIEGRRELSG